MSEQGMPMGGPMPPGPPPPMPGGQPPMAPPMQAPPPPMPQTVHDVKISRTKKYGCARVENVPPEEFGVTRRQRSVMLRDCDYCFHEVKRTQASLIADGYDKTQVEELPDYAGDNNTAEVWARDTVDESFTEGDAALNKANRQIRVTEHYVMMDYEGNGKAKRYRVTTGGEANTILNRDGKLMIEPDFVRFAAMTPFIMTHRFFGRSVADLVMDIQRIKTALIRSLLNNVYYANNQRIEVGADGITENTLDDILANRPGGIIRTKRLGSIQPVQNSDIGAFAFPLMQHMDDVREWRTGVTKQGQGLDPNALQNIGEKAVLDAQSAARTKTKLIARIFAETGIKEMFWLLHATIRQNASEADTVRLKGNWISVNPQEWKQRDNLTVNVGLGNSSKEHETGFLMQILQMQDKAVQTNSPLATEENQYNTLKRLVRIGGLKSVDPYFQDPGKPGSQKPPKPSPDQQKLQADMQSKQQQLQFDHAKAAQAGQLQQAQAAQTGELEREKMMLAHQLAQEQMQQELQLKRDQLNAELQLKRELGMMEIASRPQPVPHAAAAANNGGPGGGVSSVHVGGAPG